MLEFHPTLIGIAYKPTLQRRMISALMAWGLGTLEVEPLFSCGPRALAVPDAPGFVAPCSLSEAVGCGALVRLLEAMEDNLES